MSRNLWQPLICCLLLMPALAGAAGASDVVVKRFGSGGGVGAVGIIDASEDTEVSGPQALTAGENGELFLLDQVNNRIVRFHPKQPDADPRILGLPDDLQPTDLVVRKSDILVWDGSVRALQAKGPEDTSYRGLEEVSTRAGDDQFTLSAFAQMGSQAPGTDTDVLETNTRSVPSRQARPRARQYIASRGAGSIIVDVIPDRNGKGARIEVRPKDDPNAQPDPTLPPQPSMARQLRLKVSDRLGAVEFLEVDHGGRMFVLAENIPTDSNQAATFVARYSATGVLEGIYELPLDSNVPLTRRFVTVSGDGDVYFLRTHKTGVDVVGVGYRGMGRSKIVDVRPNRPNVFAMFFGKKLPVAAVRPLDRQQVVETAFAFEGVQWRLTPSAYGRDPDTACTGFNRIRRPGYLINKLNQEVRGVPYCWGCHGSLATFRARLERGTMAGNVCTRNAPRTDVAGVDCSAFVSAAWGLSTHFTTAAIPSISTPLSSAWDLRPGDALNKPHSHVMLFLRFTPDRKAEVMEASPGACNGRVCRNVYPVASLLARGYTPVRFKALANDTTQVAQLNVVEEAPKGKRKKKRRQR